MKKPTQLSRDAQQYLKAIGMSSADLGALIKRPTERISKKLGEAVAHETKAHNLRAEAQREFDDNIAFYYEAKQRLLNPGYRTDVDGGQNRTAEENIKHFGAPDWATFNTNCAAYSLQHADRKLKSFAQARGLLSDGHNIDDPEQNQARGQVGIRVSQAEDHTERKRYEHVATAAMTIAQRDPENPVCQQILAAAEYAPAPLLSVTADFYTELLAFVTATSKLVDAAAAIEELKPLTEPLLGAKKIIGKLLLHKPVPDPATVVRKSAEELRKRDKRLANKNGGRLGSASKVVAGIDNYKRQG